MYFSFGLSLSLRKYFDGDFDDQIGFLSEKPPALSKKFCSKLRIHGICSDMTRKAQE